MTRTRYVEHTLPNGQTVKLRVVKLPSVGRKVRRNSSREYKGRKALYSTHIPTVRRRRERKAMLHDKARQAIGPPKIATYDRPRTDVRLVDVAQLAHWSGKRVHVNRFADGEGFVVPQRHQKTDNRPPKYPKKIS